MKKNILNKSVLTVILLASFIFGNIALASEVTGTLSTGINPVGNTLTGTVTPSPTTSGGGGGGGRSGGYSPLFALGNGSGRADLNGDGKTDILDFVMLMADWGQTGSNVTGDINGDGQVDILDFVMLMANWTI